MADYIKRSDAVETLKHLLYETAINNVECAPMFSAACDEIALNRVEGYLSAVPAADVAEVVRCKDCKHYDCSYHLCKLYRNKHLKGFFCRYGERRTEDG